MSFLDRFKPQPKWKHADPAVRARGGRRDPGRCRASRRARGARARRRGRARAPGGHRAARRRATLLVRLARAERDADLRRELTERLVAIATAPADTDADAALALDGLEDPKQFSTIAKSSPHDTVRAAALGRVHDVKALSSVARHAADPQTALDAVARIADAGRAAEHRAQDRSQGRRHCGARDVRRGRDAGRRRGHARERGSARAKNKSVSKRARAMLQAIDEAEAARRLALEQWQQRVAVGPRAASRRLPPTPSAPDAAAQLADAEADWRRRRARPARSSWIRTPPAASARSSRPRACRDRRASSKSEEERRAAAERRRGASAARLSLCERVENAARRGRARRDRKGPRRVGRAAGTVGRRRSRTRACGRASKRRAGARPSGTRTGRRSQRTNARLDELSRRRPSALSADGRIDDDDAWDAVQREWALAAPEIRRARSGGRRTIRRGRRARAAARRGAPRGRRAGAEAAGAAVRAADRPRDDARRRRGPDASRGRPDRARAARGPRRAAAAAGAASSTRSSSGCKAAQTRDRARSCTSCARWTSGSGSRTPPSRRS